MEGDLISLHISDSKVSNFVDNDTFLALFIHILSLYKKI